MTRCIAKQRRQKIVLFIFTLSFLLVRTVSAQDQNIFIRAVFPNPVADEQNEWILIDATSGVASGSASTCLVTDTKGSTKQFEFSWPEEFPHWLYRSETGITLNNDQDSVSLHCDGNLLHSSKPYHDLAEGSVWWWDDQQEWQTTPLDKFMDRAESQDWLVDNSSHDGLDLDEDIPVATAGGENIREKNNNDSNSTEQESTENQVVYQSDSDHHLSKRDVPFDQLVHPRITSSWTVKDESSDQIQSTGGAVLEPLNYPSIDRDAEVAAFLKWKRHALTGSLCLVFGGVCWLSLAAPRLWHWYNEKRLLW